ncbi:MAG: Gfo/Idh/MocA family oxidoreductase [Anaerolineae bacterium]|nr:Gfo/Idh/MocA family oxidoreductase [Anaerolineae bacterium]
MGQTDAKLNVLLIGGGMISEEVVLPTVFQEQREGRVANVLVASRRAATIQHLRQVFAGRTFSGYPDPDTAPLEESRPEAFREALSQLQQPAAVIVATPDHLHTPMIVAAIEAGFDVVVEKPLCLKVDEAWQIQELAYQKGAYVYTDYHKRHDRAVRALRYRYRQGWLGEMLHGHAWIEERREIPLDHFRLWAHNSSPFEYVGVHYVDVYYFVTGLKPKRLVAFGQKKFLPQHGSDAFDAVQATIEWEDGSVLWVQTAWVNTQKNSALTNQGLQVLGTEGEYWADHKDRNLHFATERGGYEDYNPNFFKAYDSWDHPGDVDWVGYGYESIVQGLNDIRRLYLASEGLQGEERLARRRQLIAALAESRPLPEQALIGTAVNEAVRLSIANGSAYVGFDDRLYPVLL